MGRGAGGARIGWRRTTSAWTTRGCGMIGVCPHLTTKRSALDSTEDLSVHRLWAKTQGQDHPRLQHRCLARAASGHRCACRSRYHGLHDQHVYRRRRQCRRHLFQSQHRAPLPTRGRPGPQRIPPGAAARWIPGRHLPGPAGSLPTGRRGQTARTGLHRTGRPDCTTRHPLRPPFAHGPGQSLHGAPLRLYPARAGRHAARRGRLRQRCQHETRSPLFDLWAVASLAPRNEMEMRSLAAEHFPR